MGWGDVPGASRELCLPAVIVHPLSLVLHPMSRILPPQHPAPATPRRAPPATSFGMFSCEELSFFFLELTSGSKSYSFVRAPGTSLHNAHKDLAANESTGALFGSEARFTFPCGAC